MRKHTINAQWRRHIHRNPEVSFQEYETQKLIVEELTRIGDIEVITDVERTGLETAVVGILRGTAEAEADSEKTVLLLREDMDALSMQDKIETAYCSAKEGVAHKCGHDVHVATLLGAARLLHARRHTFDGEVRLVFQPGEETEGGARTMVQAGVADNVDACVSLHVMTYNEAGTVAVRDGIATASEDELHIEVRGEGGHASQPHLAVNPVSVAVHMIAAVPGYLARNVDALRRMVFTVSAIHGGSAHAVNVIADTCSFSGTLRTFDDEVRASVKSGLTAFLQELAVAFDARATVRIRHGFGAGTNAKSITDVVRRTVQDMYEGDDGDLANALLEVREPELGAEDFYEFGRDRSGKNVRPCVQFWLGGANKARGLTHDNHSPLFDVDERCLPMGAACLAGTALQFFGATRTQTAAKRRRKDVPNAALRTPW